MKFKITMRVSDQVGEPYVEIVEALTFMDALSTFIRQIQESLGVEGMFILIPGRTFSIDVEVEE